MPKSHRPSVGAVWTNAGGNTTPKGHAPHRIEPTCGLSQIKPLDTTLGCGIVAKQSNETEIGKFQMSVCAPESPQGNRNGSMHHNLLRLNRFRLIVPLV